MTDNSDFRISSFGTVRGRIGYAFDRFLPYATGGYAWAQTRMDYSQPVTGFFSSSLSDLHQSKMRSGWTVGGGLEYAVAAHWTTKIEYLYYDFGEADYSGLFFSAPFNASTKLTMQTLKLGVNYRF